MYSRCYSLKSERRIKHLFSERRQIIRGTFCILAWKMRHSGHLHLVISVSKKIEKRATRRNYWRRVLSELARQHLFPLLVSLPMDVLIVFRFNGDKPDFVSLSNDFLSLMKKVMTIPHVRDL